MVCSCRMPLASDLDVCVSVTVPHVHREKATIAIDENREWGVNSLNDTRYCGIWLDIEMPPTMPHHPHVVGEGGVDRLDDINRRHLLISAAA